MTSGDVQGVSIISTWFVKRACGIWRPNACACCGTYLINHVHHVDVIICDHFPHLHALCVGTDVPITGRLPSERSSNAGHWFLFVSMRMTFNKLSYSRWLRGLGALTISFYWYRWYVDTILFLIESQTRNYKLHFIAKYMSALQYVLILDVVYCRFFYLWMVFGDPHH